MARIPLLDREIRLDLAGHVTAQVHVAEGLTLVGEVENNSAGKLVVGGAGAISRLKNVNAVPFARALRTGSNTCKQHKTKSARVQIFCKPPASKGWKPHLTLLKENNAGKSIVQIPKVNASDSALVVQLAVNIKGLVRCDLELAHLLAGNGAVLQWGVELVAPW
jgi:hypothetical protein